MIICIDPGHSGPVEPGAVNGCYTEARLALQIALYTAATLSDRGHQVLLTRTDDIESDLLAWRVDLANDAAADLFVSIHINAATIPTARGIETYCMTRSDAGAELAQAIQSTLAALGFFPDRGVKESSFYVLRATAMPAALVECGFLTNALDLAVITSGTARAAIGRAIAQGIETYLNTR